MRNRTSEGSQEKRTGRRKQRKAESREAYETKRKATEMSKYIELGKAIGAVRGAFEFKVETPLNYRDIAVETLKLLPSVEVVRCRECVMWDGSFTLNGQKKCLNMTFCTDGDFYCGWGSKE